jgi:hypothetical protein
MPGLRRSERAEAAINDPVSFVIESKSLMNDVCSLLLGIPPEEFFSQYASQSRRKTRYFKCNKGIFGHCLAYIGVVEDHAKGTLHYHILLYGGLSPYLLQRFASLGQVCDAISKALDEMYRSSLPEKSLYNSVMKRIVKRPYNGYGLTSKDLVQSNLDPILERPDAINGIRNNEDFDVNWIMEKTIQQADVQEWHEHMKTCHNGFLGRDGCRMCYPAGEVNATGPVLLVPKDSDDSNDGGRYDGEADMYDDLLESDEHVLE